MIDRIVTVTGAIENPKNLLVRLGTTIDRLIESCGKTENGANYMILGGPMMGVSIVNSDFPVTKGMNCVLVRKGRAPFEQNCINCGRCVNICPMKLMPLAYVRYVRKGDFEVCREYYIENCIECGCCSYVCPANIPIVGYIKTGKNQLLKIID